MAYGATEAAVEGFRGGVRRGGGVQRTPPDDVLARGRRPAPEGTTTGGGNTRGRARGRRPRCRAVQRRLARRMAVQRASGGAREGGRTAVAASATGGGRLRSISSGGEWRRTLSPPDYIEESV